MKRSSSSTPKPGSSRKRSRSAGDTPNLEDFTLNDKYELLEEIGKGASGTVYKARDKQNNQIVAYKLLKFKQAYSLSKPRQIIEVDNLIALQHKNIVRILETLKLDGEPTEYVIVFEYVEFCLSYLLFNDGVCFTEEMAYFLMKQLFAGLNYIHESGFAHRDIKCSNILLDRTGNLKICDLGSSTFSAGKRLVNAHEFGTRGYKAPEVLLNLALYDSKVDIWGAGCVYYSILSNKRLLRRVFRREDDFQSEFIRMCEVLGTPTEEMWPDSSLYIGGNMWTVPKISTHRARLWSWLRMYTTNGLLELMKRILAYDPKQRFSAKEALEDNYFKNNPYNFKYSRFRKQFRFEIERIERRREKKEASRRRSI